MAHVHTHTHAAAEHEHAVEATSNDLAKLRVLLPHWIDHNEDHANSFRRWAAKARALGQEETAQRIEEAIEQMAACNEALTAALELLEG
jgi:alcohol dehydrogenase YqhD (iron-dependent ADH family)